ncbi:MAG: NHL repeat-containing protein [Deltaproteobacteria bacterium]|nr:NHL repeat-containing protein [Deltaproteobacteria bacterium]
MEVHGEDLTPVDVHGDVAAQDVHLGDAASDRAPPQDLWLDQSHADQGLDGPFSDSFACPGGATTFSTNMPARHVLGQADFVTSAANRGGLAGAGSLNRPLGLVVYQTKLLVADSGNNRIMVFDAYPEADGVAATAVIGQPNFSTTTGSTSSSTLNGPQGLALSDDALLVSEWTNARATLWPLSTIFSTPSLSLVFGQTDAVSAVATTTNVTAQTLGAVASVIAIGSRYVITDSQNHRVLVFDSLTGNPPSALAAIGQPDLLSNTLGSDPEQSEFPLGLASDGRRLIVVESGNNRLLFFDTAPTSSGAQPDLVWGGYGNTALTLDSPVGAFTDGIRLFVADRSSDRVLIFNSLPTSPAQAADVVLGQANFTSRAHNQGNDTIAAANTLWGVHFVFFDGCRLFVSDTQNNRVLIY